MNLLKTDNNQIGLDIGSTSIRLVQVKASRPNPQLITYGVLPIAAKMVESESAHDRQQLGAAIKKLLHDSKVSTRNVVVGLPSDKIFASVISIPKMNQQDLAKAVAYQAEEYVPMPMDQVKLDWLVVGESGDGKQHEVLLVAAPNSLCESYMGMLESAGLEVIGIEPNAFGLTRSLVNNITIAMVILNLGAKATDLVTVYQGTPRLIRSIGIGGETLIRAAAQNLNLSDEQAQEFVWKFGLTQSKLEGQIYKAVKSSIDVLVGEVNKSNKFFASRYKDVQIEKLIVSGGASLLPELPTYLANAVNLPVEIGNAWSHVSFPLTMQEELLGLSGQFGVAAGMATRGMV